MLGRVGCFGSRVRMKRDTTYRFGYRAIANRDEIDCLTPSPSAASHAARPRRTRPGTLARQRDRLASGHPCPSGSLDRRYARGWTVSSVPARIPALEQGSDTRDLRQSTAAPLIVGRSRRPSSSHSVDDGAAPAVVLSLGDQPLVEQAFQVGESCGGGRLLCG